MLHTQEIHMVIVSFSFSIHCPAQEFLDSCMHYSRQNSIYWSVDSCLDMGLHQIWHSPGRIHHKNLLYTEPLESSPNRHASYSDVVLPSAESTMGHVRTANIHIQSWGVVWSFCCRMPQVCDYQCVAVRWRCLCVRTWHLCTLWSWDRLYLNGAVHIYRMLKDSTGILKNFLWEGRN